jgi:hypothetical protein
MRIQEALLRPTITETPIANVHDLFQLLNRALTYFVIQLNCISIVTTTDG